MRARRFCALVVALAWAVSAQAGPAMAGALSVVLDDFGVQQPRVHKPAPAFSLARLDGGQMGLADMRGKLVLVHFWATWCVACRHEMPQIEQLWQRYRKRGLMVLGINVDRGDLDSVRAFVRERGVSFPTVLDPSGSVRNRYEVRALPTTYLIGRDGKIIGRIIGERDWASQAADVMMSALVSQEGGGE